MRRYALLAALASVTLVAASACSSDYQDAEARDGGTDAADATSPGTDGSDPIVERSDAGDGGTDANDRAPADGGLADADADADADPSADADADAGQVDASPPCPAGFEPSAGNGCVVSNPFKDPSFTGAPANAWTTGGGGVVLPAEPGAFGPGVAEIANDTANPPRYRGWVEQSISIPSTPEIDPFAFHVDLSVINSALDTFAAGLYIDGVALGDPILGTSPRTLKRAKFSYDLCLGERAYGKNHAFKIGSTSFVDSVFIEGVGLVRDVTCPRPGIVVNGGFEAGGGFEYARATIPFSITGGTNNSRSARLAARERTYPDTIFQSLSIPNKSTVALSFRTYGKGNVRVLVDARSIIRRPVDGTHDAHVVCLPPWSHGLVSDVSIASGQSDYTASSEDTDVFFVDDVALVDSPGCADGSRSENAGFELLSDSLGDDIPGWSTSVSNGYAITRKTTQAHGGAASLSVKAASSACASGYGPDATVSRVFTLPTVTPALGGAALRYWYRLGGATTAVAKVYSDELYSVTLAPAAAWTSGVRCLNPNQPGTRVGVEFVLAATGGAGCGDAELEIDDVSVGNDVSCPLN